MRETQAEKLYNHLKRNPRGAGINELRQELFIMNIMEAKRQANLKRVEKGELIETFEIRKTQNGRPVNGYRLISKMFVPPLSPPKYVNPRQESQTPLFKEPESRAYQ